MRHQYFVNIITYPRERKVLMFHMGANARKMLPELSLTILFIVFDDKYVVGRLLPDGQKIYVLEIRPHGIREGEPQYFGRLSICCVVPCLGRGVLLCFPL